MWKGHVECFKQLTIIFKLRSVIILLLKNGVSVIRDLEFIKVSIATSAPASYNAWNYGTDILEITWSSLISIQMKNPLALPKIIKLVRDRGWIINVLWGSPKISAELNKAHISHRTLAEYLKRPCLVLLSA